MPGAPGSSQRCEQCRRRKKKCGLEKPQCLRCVNSGLKCGGTTEETVYVHRDTENIQHTSQRAALVAALRGREIVTQSHLSHGSEVDLDCQNSLSLSKPTQIHRQSLYYAIVDEFRPEKGPGQGMFAADRAASGKSRLSSFAHCTRSLIPLVDLSLPVVDNCLFSVFALYLGTRRFDQGLVDIARSAYTNALAQFNDFIRQEMPRLSQSHDNNVQNMLLYLSMALYLFEYLDETGHEEAFCAHARASSRILKLAGPQAFISEQAQQAFNGLRGLIVSLCICERIPCFLTEWTWAQQSFIHTAKAERDFLIDIGSRIPTFLHQVDEFMKRSKGAPASHPRPAFDQLHIFRASHATLNDELSLWLAALHGSSPEPLFWPLDDLDYLDPQFWAGYDSECIPTLGGTSNVWLFPSGWIAGLLATYWGYVLELSMAAMAIERYFHTYDASSDPKPGESSIKWQEHYNNAAEAARMILGAGPYLTSCLEGAIILKAPLHSARRFFRLWGGDAAIPHSGQEACYEGVMEG